MSEITLKKFEMLLNDLSETEQLELISYIVSKFKHKQVDQQRRLIDLSGFLVGKVGPDFDIDNVLKEARS